MVRIWVLFQIRLWARQGQRSKAEGSGKRRARGAFFALSNLHPSQAVTAAARQAESDVAELKEKLRWALRIRLPCTGVEMS